MRNVARPLSPAKRVYFTLVAGIGLTVKVCRQAFALPVSGSASGCTLPVIWHLESINGLLPRLIVSHQWQMPLIRCKLDRLPI
jgi:hypothetical protein